MQVITDVTEIGGFLNDLQESDYVSLDTETTGLDFWKDKLLLLQLEVNENAYIFDYTKLPNRILTYIIDLVNETGKRVIGHNIKFDLKFLKENTGIMLKNVHDTQVVEVLTYNGLPGTDQYPSYEDLVWKHFKVKLNKEIRNKFIGATEITQDMLEYAEDDVKYLKGIADKQIEILSKQNQIKILELENRLSPVIADIEHHGIPFDTKAWLEQERKQKEVADEHKIAFIVELSKEIDFRKFPNALEMAEYFAITDMKKTKKDREYAESVLEKEEMRRLFYEYLNIGSYIQLRNVLNEVFDEEDKIESTNEKVWSPLVSKYPVLEHLKEYKSADKVASTYGSNFLEYINTNTGRLLYELNQVGTRSGRFSSSKPNMQNIPATTEYRSCVRSMDDDYVLVTIDYSQMELRSAGWVFREPAIIDIYKHDGDIHALSASNVYDVPLIEVTKDQRKTGKTLNFALLYGTSEYGLHYNFGFSLADAREMLPKYFKGYPYLHAGIEYSKEKILEKKYSATQMGRKRFFEDKALFDDNRDRWKYRGMLEREGINHIIQGSCADVIKIAMCEIWHKNPFGDKLRILLQIHDELVFEIHKSVLLRATRFVKNAMLDAQQPFIGEIPAKVDLHVSTCWQK